MLINVSWGFIFELGTLGPGGFCGTDYYGWPGHGQAVTSPCGCVRIGIHGPSHALSLFEAPIQIGLAVMGGVPHHGRVAHHEATPY